MIAWDKYYPSLSEVELAKDIFNSALKDYQSNVINGDMSKDLVIKCALSEVWTAGKKYQDKHHQKGLSKMDIKDITELETFGNSFDGLCDILGIISDCALEGANSLDNYENGFSFIFNIANNMRTQYKNILSQISH